MSAALAAAHIGHEIEHSSAFMGFLIGAAVGLVVGVAIVAATVATGGAALAVVAAVGGAVASTGGGALAGKYIGEAIKNPKGPINTGSANVFYGPSRIPAARAILDTVACKDHGLKFLATGSDSVFINIYPAVRNDDKSECDGTVKSDIDHIFIGAETLQYLEIEKEVPDWMVNVALGMVIAGTAVALLAGGAAAFMAGGWCALGTFGLQVAGGIIGGAILAPVGGMIGNALGGELGKRIGETLGGMLGGALGARAGGLLGRRTMTGHPVDVATGELFTSEVDFTISGLVSIPWTRSWTSSSTLDGALGAKWHHPLDMALFEADDCRILRTDHGRLILLPDLAPGQSFWHRAESLLATHSEDGVWRIRKSDGLTYELAPAGGGAGLRLDRIGDGNGNVLRLAYDGRGAMREVTGSDGIRYLFTHDDQGRITAICKTDGETRAELVRYDYDRAGDLVQATDPLGQAFGYSYENHLILRETRRSGLSFHFLWDDPDLGLAARCIRTWGDGDIYWRALDYAPAERVTRVTNGKGAVETYFYNEIGLVTGIISPLGAHSQCSINRFGETESATDANGGMALWRFDPFGRLVELRDPLGAQTVLGYASDDPLSPNFINIASETDASGATVRMDYDARGNLVSRTDAAGFTLWSLRDGRGLLLSVQDDLGTRARFSWSAEGRLLTERNSKGGRVSYAHDAFGLVIREEMEGSAPIHYRYDRLERLTEIRQDGGEFKAFSYNADGLLSALKEADGAASRWDFAGLPFPVARLNADGTSFRYGYDGEMNLVRLTNERGEDYRLDYDLDERLVRECGFDGHELHYRYDAAGHLVEQQDLHRRHLFTRDALGQLVQRESGDGTWARYGYDAVGRLTSAVNAVREVAFSYDPRGLLLGETQDGAELSHSYSPRGRRIATLLPDGRLLGFGYDENGDFDSLSLDSRNVVTLSRDRMGRERLREAGGLRQSTDYDPQGRLQRQMAYLTGGAQPLMSKTYSYDGNGRIARIDDLLRGRRDYRYDSRDQLREVDGSRPESFQFDPAGMIVAQLERATDASVKGGRLMMRADSHYEYDDAGNRILQRRAQGGRHVFRYGYDDMNQLVSVHETRGRTEKITEFSYDALGRRVSKSHREVLRAANDAGPDTGNRQAVAEYVRDETVWFLWNDDVLLAEARGDRNGAADPTALVYVYEPEGFRPLAQIRRHDPQAAGEVLLYWLDHLGTPLEISNEKGEIVWQVALKAWGGVADLAVARVDNNLRFPGQYHDVETGLHYNRFRHYDPEAGAFINKDPVRLLGGENLSLYAPNPLSWSDPLGLDKDDWHNYRRENSHRGWTPAEMSENYRKTVEYRRNNPVSDGTHGNSHNSTKPAVGYILRDKDTHAVVKFGETSERVPTRRYTQAYYDRHNVYMDVVKRGSKQQMHQWQHDRIMQYKDRHGFRPALNFCNY